MVGKPGVQGYGRKKGNPSLQFREGFPFFPNSLELRFLWLALPGILHCFWSGADGR
jgi:hypothetical protein